MVTEGVLLLWFSLSLQFESAAAEVLVGLKSKVAGDTGEMEEPTTGEVQVLLSSKENPSSMRALGVIYWGLLYY